MKKLLALMLVLSMALSLAACGSSGAADASKPAESTEETAEATAEKEEPAAEESKTEEPAAEESKTEESAAPAEGVNRIIIFNTAVTTLQSSDQPRGTEKRPAYSFKDVIDAYQIKGTTPCQVIGSDGYTADESYDDLVKKYFTFEGESAPIIVGEAQDPDWAVWEVAYVRIGNDVLMTSYTEDIPFTKVFEDLGMVKADNYDFICSDGYTCTISADELDKCSLRQIEGRADGIVPGVGDDSLWALLYVQPAA